MRFRSLKRNDGLQRQIQCGAERPKRPEGRPPTAGEQVAKRAFVHSSLAPEISTGPAPLDSRAINRYRVDPPYSRGRHAVTLCEKSRTDATVLFVLRTPWKARCYAFRAIRPTASSGTTHSFWTAGSVVFGGPLLGDPDRPQGAAAGSPTGAAEREAIASPTTRLSVHSGNIATRSRCASRARVRARAAGRSSPIARPAGVARLRPRWQRQRSTGADRGVDRGP